MIGAHVKQNLRVARESPSQRIHFFAQGDRQLKGFQGTTQYLFNFLPFFGSERRASLAVFPRSLEIVEEGQLSSLRDKKTGKDRR